MSSLLAKIAAMADPQNIRDEAEKAYQTYLVTTGVKKAKALELYLRLCATYNANSPDSRPLYGYLNNGRTV